MHEAFSGGVPPGKSEFASPPSERSEEGGRPPKGARKASKRDVGKGEMCGS